MRSVIAQFRRAPGRILASVLALALAVGAVGVLAIPHVSTGTLHEAAARDGLADIVVTTTPLDAGQVEALTALPGVAAAEGQVSIGVELDDGTRSRVVGLPLGPDQQMDRLQLDAGRLPSTAGEVVASPGAADVGDVVAVGGEPLEVVGVGTTLWRSSDAVVYADVDHVAAIAPEGGTNHLVVTATDDSIESLRSIADEIRDALAVDGDTFTTFPEYLPDGTTPIDADIEQVSTLIGLLGIVAGIVALVLLASTTTTLITERTREVAVMRALGGRERPLRRRLRRLSLGITAVALLVGLPLGIVISNVIARMVLQEFVGISPDVAVDWRVVVASALAALIGARLVSARAARKVVRAPLATALRDREGSPFGGRRTHRFVARIPTGGLIGRMATRVSVHRPGRTIATVAQVSAAVGAAFLVPSLVTSVNDFNSASHAVWSWESLTIARDPGLPLPVDIEAGRDDIETGIWDSGEVGDWQVDVYGLPSDPSYFDPMLRDGRWVDAGEREVVVSAGFADREAMSIGDAIDVELAPGIAGYEIVGLSDDHARTLYTDRDVLADDLGAPGMANVVWSSEPDPMIDASVAARTNTAADLAADDNAARNAIVTIFGAIGAIVAGVAALAVISSMTVSLYERRHQFAALQAIGGRRRVVRRLVFTELVPIGVVGVVTGLAVGALGTRGIIGSFEASNAVDIGVTDAVWSIPPIAAGTFLVLGLLTVLVVRSAGRRPVAVMLRGAA